MLNDHPDQGLLYLQVAAGKVGLHGPDPPQSA